VSPRLAGLRFAVRKADASTLLSAEGKPLAALAFPQSGRHCASSSCLTEAGMASHSPAVFRLCPCDRIGKDFAMRAAFALLAISSLAIAGPAAAGPQARNSNSADPAEKMICKRFVRTGSLVDGYKTCKTKREWDREHENLQHLELVDSCRLRGAGGGCGA
jgi:hypothetical protein